MMFPCLAFTRIREGNIPERAPLVAVIKRKLWETPMKKWILLGLALVSLGGCAYYPDDYRANGYGYYGGSAYHRDYSDRYGRYRYGYRHYDRDYDR
jgi:hypothetical protein